MASFASNMVRVMAMANNYDDRMVDRTELENGLIVSTAYTTDYGYETAILGQTDGVYPVERYGEVLSDEVKQGHARWVEFAKNGLGKTITCLGSGPCDFYPENSQITL